MNDGLVLFYKSGVGPDRICSDCGSVLTESREHTEKWVRSYVENSKQQRPRLYRIWSGIKTRCTNPNSNSYKYYGARGFKLCREWLTYSTFRAWALANGYRPGLKIERVDNDRGYFPDNCTFATDQQQVQNRRLPARAKHGRRYNRTTLTEADVYDIRESTLTNQALSVKYQVHNSTIANIRNRKSWANLPERT